MRVKAPPGGYDVRPIANPLKLPPAYSDETTDYVPACDPPKPEPPKPNRERLGLQAIIVLGWAAIAAILLTIAWACLRAFL